MIEIDSSPSHGRTIVAALLGVGVWVVSHGAMGHDATVLGSPHPHAVPQHTHAYVTKKVGMHPVDYWWHLEPSEKGRWDYATPREHAFEPVAAKVHQPVTIEYRPVPVGPPVVVNGGVMGLGGGVYAGMAAGVPLTASATVYGGGMPQQLVPQMALPQTLPAGVMPGGAAIHPGARSLEAVSRRGMVLSGRSAPLPVGTLGNPGSLNVPTAVMISSGGGYNTLLAR